MTNNFKVMTQIFPGEVFANTKDFDFGMRQLLPRYDEMLEVITDCLPSQTQRILELGCGTGELSLKILKALPNAEITALDYSPRMVKFAHEKIVAAGFENRWHGIEADFGEWANHPETLGIGTGFDACVSSLAIHHLTDEMKQKLIQQVAASLKPQSCFWNADPTLPETPALAEVYEAAREKWISQQGIDLAAVRSQMGKSDTQGYSSQDQLATLNHNLEMLKTAGFTNIAVPWKLYKIAVFGGFTAGN
jgi:trans-aconitate 2-methyltransferase